MKKLIELLAEVLSVTKLGDEVHYLVEAREQLDGLVNQVFYHTCKLVSLPTDRASNKWRGDVEVFLLQIATSPLYNKATYQERSKLLIKPLSSFKERYRYVQVKFNNAAKLSKVKNQKLISNLTPELEAEIIAYYEMLVDAFLEDNLEKFLYSD